MMYFLIFLVLTLVCGCLSWRYITAPIRQGLKNLKKAKDMLSDAKLDKQVKTILNSLKEGNEHE